jgi:hypothetical protein
MYPDYLVPPNDQSAEVARRKIEANMIRWETGELEKRGFSKAFKDKTTGQMITPDGKTDDALVDDYEYALMGIKAGQLNTDYGFVLRWSEVERRATDNKIIIQLPPEGAMRDAILFGVGLPKTIEAGQDDWFTEV